MSPGINQERKMCKYLLVGVYTFPVTRKGHPLIEADQQEPQDQPLPDPGELTGEEVLGDDQLQKDLLQEQEEAEFWGEGEDGRVAEESTNGCLDAWQKPAEDSQNVAVRNATMVEVVESRTVQHILPAVARIYSRLRQLGLPVMRLHSDRAREFTSLAVRRWAQARDIVVTKTSGDNYKANGRCERALGQIKRATRTVLSAGGHNVNWWPLAAKHVGERKLRSQLRALGYLAGDLLQFGAQAFALRKWWHHRYEQWQDIREPVVVLGPDACSTLSTTNYFVQAIETGRYFFTDDVIIPNFQAIAEADQVPPQEGQHEDAAVAPRPNSQEIYLPERDEQSRPAGFGMIPPRRLRTKTAPATLHTLSMGSIEGETCGGDFQPSTHQFNVDFSSQLHNVFENLGSSSQASNADSDSWTLETRPSTQPSVSETSGSLEEDGSSGGDVKEAPNSWCGGSSPAAPSRGREGFPRQMHGNLSELVQEEMGMVDATTIEQDRTGMVFASFVGSSDKEGGGGGRTSSA